MRSNLLLVLSFLFTFSNAIASGTDDPFAMHFNQSNHVAIHGYDVVSYHTGTPSMGTNKFSVDYRNVIFNFINQANADEFESNPEKYVPAYGGWCATAMGTAGTKLDINPLSFAIQDSVLYLFSTSMGTAKEQWIKGLPSIKQKADSNWVRLTEN